MRARNRLLAAAAWCLGLSLAFSETTDPKAPPRDVGLVEATGQRLVQLDVSVSGPEERIRDLTVDDFEVTIGGQPIEGFLLDRMCVDAEAAGGDSVVAQDDAAGSQAPAGPGMRFLFYFDQSHLTAAGRDRALEVARDLVPQLVNGSTRATIVSGGRETRVFADWTGDRQRLLDALDALERDSSLWDPFPTQESTRVEQIQQALRTGTEAAEQWAQPIREQQRQAGSARLQRGGSSAGPTSRGLDRQLDNTLDRGTQMARTMARTYYREESWHTERALNRFSMALGRMAGLDPPKAVVYFADTMRSRPGEHYLAMVQEQARKSDDKGAAAGGYRRGEDRASGLSSPYFERVVAEATSHGVRLYPVQAEGLVQQVDLATRDLGSATQAPRSTPNTSLSARFRDAQNSLVGLAAESGGRAFLNGAGAKKIARDVLDDLSCFFLISFEPGDLPQDEPLRVLVTVKQPKVDARTRSTLLVKSAAARRDARLLAAFTTPATTDDSGVRLRGFVIPTGFADGKYSALVQVAVPPSPLPRSTWEIGVSMVARDQVPQESSGSLTVDAPGVPLVLETEMSFRPGPFELVAVAREVGTDQVATTRLAGEWPDPSEETATIGPLALLQPTDGAFLRGEQLRKQGSFGVGSRDVARTDLPAAMVGIVCHDPGPKRKRKKNAGTSLRVERRIVGESAAEFETLDLAGQDDTCVSFRDLIRAGTMTSGMFTYEVRVLEGDEEIASASRRFAAIAPGDEMEADTGASSL